MSEFSIKEVAKNSDAAVAPNAAGTGLSDSAAPTKENQDVFKQMDGLKSKCLGLHDLELTDDNKQAPKVDGQTKDGLNKNNMDKDSLDKNGGNKEGQMRDGGQKDFAPRDGGSKDAEPKNGTAKDGEITDSIKKSTSEKSPEVKNAPHKKLPITFDFEPGAKLY